jgi:hypothetical protein
MNDTPITGIAVVSFRDARPPDYPPDMAALTEQMHLSRPVSLRALIGDLSAPTAVQFSSGPLRAQGCLASAYWTLNAQGFSNFSGSINNSDAITQQYAVGMTLNVRDANGDAIGVMHSGQVGPNLPLFNNNASWNDTGFDQRILDLWPSIFGLQYSSAAADLKVSDNVADSIEAVLEVLLEAVAGAVAVVVVVVGGALLVGGKLYTCAPTNNQAARSREGVVIDWECHVGP